MSPGAFTCGPCFGPILYFLLWPILYCKGLAACAADPGYSEFLIEFLCEDAFGQHLGAIEASCGSHSEEIWTPWGARGSPGEEGSGKAPGPGDDRPRPRGDPGCTLNLYQNPRNPTKPDVSLNSR